MFDVWFSLTVCPSFFHDSNSRRIHCVRHLLVFSLYHVLAPNFFAILFGRKSLELVCKKSGNNVSKSTKMSQKSYVSEAKIQIWKVTGIPRKIVSEKNVEKKNMRLFDRFLTNVGTVAQLLHPIEIWVLTFLSIVSYLNVYAT